MTKHGAQLNLEVQRRLVGALFCSVLLLALPGCGSIVTSSKSAPRFSKARPVPLGDVNYYYLPRGIIKVDGVQDSSKSWTVTVGTDIHADPNERYELALNARYPFFDHTAVFTTDERGLLKKVDATSTDHTVDSVAAVIETVGKAFTFGAAAGVGRGLNASDNRPFHLIFDPFDGPLTKTKGDFTISVSAPPPELPFEGKMPQSAAGRWSGV
ncbi:MAG: hypothetical protein M3Y86_09255, partial [Verrucomicrobiota bacterium]|nr:hypothetical protein [Verrucomicrobiota bacterium]